VGWGNETKEIKKFEKSISRTDKHDRAHLGTRPCSSVPSKLSDQNKILQKCPTNGGARSCLPWHSRAYLSWNFSEFSKLVQKWFFQNLKHLSCNLSKSSNFSKMFSIGLKVQMIEHMQSGRVSACTSSFLSKERVFVQIHIIGPVTLSWEFSAWVLTYRLKHVFINIIRTNKSSKNIKKFSNPLSPMRKIK